MTSLGELFKWKCLLTEGIVWTARKSQSKFLSGSGIEGKFARRGGGRVYSKGTLGDRGPCSRSWGDGFWGLFERTYGHLNALTWIVRGTRTYCQRRD